MAQNTNVLMRRRSQQEQDFQKIVTSLNEQGFRVQPCGGDAIQGWLIFPVEEGREVAKLRHIRGEWLLSIQSAAANYQVLFACLPLTEDSHVYPNPNEERTGVVFAANDAQHNSKCEVPNGTPTPGQGVGVPQGDAADFGEEYWGIGISFQEELEYLRDSANSLADREIADRGIANYLWAAVECFDQALRLL